MLLASALPASFDQAASRARIAALRAEEDALAAELQAELQNTAGPALDLLRDQLAKASKLAFSQE